MTCFDLSDVFSVLRFSGSTWLDFLQRMSTGDLRGMRAGEGRATVLTTPLARIVDWLWVFAEEQGARMLVSAGARSKVAHWLRKHIFFNDDVQVHDTPSREPIFALLDAPPPSACAADLPPLGHCQQQSGGGPIWVVRLPKAFGHGWLVMGNWQPAEPPLPREAWEEWRIARGVPAYPNELNEDYIPLEAGLWGAVSFNKGCYTGQEIIARMESRGQIAKRLCLLEGESKLSVGSRLFDEHAEPVGTVTSAAGRSALGYVRSAVAKPEAVLRTEQGERVQVRAIVRM